MGQVNKTNDPATYGAGGLEAERRELELPTSSGPPVEDADTISPNRRRVVYALALILVVGHLWDNIFVTEHWPFSRYQMYSYMPKIERLRKIRLYGVTSEREEIELIADIHFAPFTMARFDAAMKTLLKPPVDPAVTSEALSSFAAFYERGRIEGRHDDPPLHALRVYKVRWDLEPQARNVGHPDKRVLLLEFNTHAH